MKRFFLAVAATTMMLALNTHAHAQATDFDTNDLDATLEMAHPGFPGFGPGRGPGFGPGRGPGFGPGWGPGRRPQPPPPPPPHQNYEILTCSSVGYQYAECYFDPRGVQNISLARQLSHSQCAYGRTYGIDRDRIWVDGGCRAQFAIQRRSRF